MKYTVRLDARARKTLDRLPSDLHARVVRKLDALEENPRPFGVEKVTGPEDLYLLRSRFQIGTLKRGQNIKYMPCAFTEQGVAMLSSVLRSSRAVKVNIEIMRAFVRIRQWLTSNAELARKLAVLEKKYDTQFKVVFDVIRQLMKPPPMRM
jgi:hypothetical protein